MPATGRLIDPDDSLLVIIDVQPAFLDRVEPKTGAGLVERVARGLGRAASRPG